MDRAETILLYGETGSGKTAQLGELAKWTFETSGKLTRLISADSSWDPVAHLVQTPQNPSGIIEAVNIQYLKNPFPILVKLGEGWWPKLTDTLEPATTPAGNYLMTPPSIVAQPPLGSGVSLEAGKMRSSNGKLIGMYAVEGLQTIANLLMQDHIRNLRKIAEDIVGDFAGVADIEVNGKQTTESQKFGKSGRAHYGHVQDFLLLDLVPRFATLPVERVVWTSHEAKGDDDITGIKNTVLGPATIGKAAVPKTAQKFGDSLHLMKNLRSRLDQATKETVYDIDYRAYYQGHPDDVLKQMLWPAKLSLPLSRVADLRKQFPGGFVPLTLDKGGLDRYLEFKHSGNGNLG